VKANNLQISVIILFYLILLLPVIEMKLQLLPQKKNTENRKLNELPKFDINLLDPFPKQFEKFFDDHFGGRVLAVSFNNYLHKKILKINDPNSTVLIGQDDYLYWAAQSLPQHRNFTPFSAIQVDNLVSKFKVRANWLTKKGIKFYVVFAPVKQRIYPEFMPFSLANYGIPPKSDQIYDALKSRLPQIPLIDLREKLVDARSTFETYPKTDNHWNDYGAFIAYTELINRIKQDFQMIMPLQISNFEVKIKNENGGNLATILSLEEEMKEASIKLIPKFKPLAVYGQKQNYEGPGEFKYNVEFEVVKEVNDKSLPKAVIIRDSFCGGMMPYLSENFSKSVYIWDAWQYKENRKIIENEKPDLVILEIVEDKLEQMLLWLK
jgi:hypothetical protein